MLLIETMCYYIYFLIKIHILNSLGGLHRIWALFNYILFERLYNNARSRMGKTRKTVGKNREIKHTKLLDIQQFRI